jgi:bifunctional DNA-binding transcriptional regulator/antitoxin component of YhaV-PrlF toxin-antitoxin module
MRATIRKWGNSAAVRLGKKELDRLGLREGDDVEIEVRPRKPAEWDVSMIPVFRSTDGLTFKEARKAMWGQRHQEKIQGKGRARR